MRLGDSVRAALRVRLLGNLVLLAVALGGTLAAVEVGLRAARLLRAQDRPLVPWEARDNEWTFYQYDSLLGWRNRPGGAGWFSMPDSRTYVQINSHGLRDGEHAFARRRARVLVLGDSFTWGLASSKTSGTATGSERHSGRTSRSSTAASPGTAPTRSCSSSRPKASGINPT